MDFNDTPEEAAFRAEVARLPRCQCRKRDRAAQRGRYSPTASIAPRRWRAPRPGRRRRPTPALPASPGRRNGAGAAASPIQQVIYNQEEANYAVPRGLFEIGLGMCIPTMMAYGAAGAARALRAAGAARRGDLVPVVLRAGRRLRPRGAAHARGARRRRLDHQRPEDLDLRRAFRRFRHHRRAHRSRTCRSTRASPSSSST